MLRIAAIAAAALLLAVPCYAQKTGAQLNSEIQTNFPDQNQGLITPQGLRTVTQDMVNSIMPTAPVTNGNFACYNGTTGLLKDCGTAPPVSQLANTFYAAPNGSAGLPSFRLQVLADLPSTGNASSLLGNPTGAAGAPSWVTLDPTLSFAGTTLKCTTFGSAQAGCVPASGGGTTSFMRADGSWATPAGGGNVTGPGSSTSGHLATFSGTTGTIIQDQAAISTIQDISFGGVRPWCDVRAHGAVGDGVTSDLAAFNACKATGGAIYVPNGNYCVGGFIFDTFGGVMFGESRSAVQLANCTFNSGCTVTASNQNQVVHDIGITGYGFSGAFGTNPFGVGNNAAFCVTPAASSSHYYDMVIIGGTANIFNQCNGCLFQNIVTSYAYGDRAGHQAAMAVTINSGQYWLRDTFDQVPPITSPQFPSTIGLWPATTTVTAGTVVQVSVAGASWWIQYYYGVTAFTVAVAGSGGTNGTNCHVTIGGGSTGNAGHQAIASVNIAGGAITTVNGVIDAGIYATFPSSPAPVASSSCGIVPTGATLNIARNTSTTGASVPTMQNYNTTITDGSALALLNSPSVYSAFQADSGSAAGVFVTESDMTTLGTDCIVVTDTYGVGVPGSIYFTRDTPGGCTHSDFGIYAGTDVVINGGYALTCVLAGCANVFFGTTNLYATASTFQGGGTVTALKTEGGSAFGIEVGTIGSNLANVNIHDNFITGAASNPISIATSQDYVSIVGNHCLGSTGTISAPSPGAHNYIPTGGNPGC